jgi:hypothetical protein
MVSTRHGNYDLPEGSRIEARWRTSPRRRTPRRRSSRSTSTRTPSHSVETDVPLKTKSSRKTSAARRKLAGEHSDTTLSRRDQSAESSPVAVQEPHGGLAGTLSDTPVRPEHETPVRRLSVTVEAGYELAPGQKRATASFSNENGPLTRSQVRRAAALACRATEQTPRSTVSTSAQRQSSDHIATYVQSSSNQGALESESPGRGSQQRAPRGRSSVPSATASVHLPSGMESLPRERHHQEEAPPQRSVSSSDEHSHLYAVREAHDQTTTGTGVVHGRQTGRRSHLVQRRTGTAHAMNRDSVPGKKGTTRAVQRATKPKQHDGGVRKQSSRAVAVETRAIARALSSMEAQELCANSREDLTLGAMLRIRGAHGWLGRLQMSLSRWWRLWRGSSRSPAASTSLEHGSPNGLQSSRTDSREHRGRYSSASSDGDASNGTVQRTRMVGETATVSASADSARECEDASKHTPHKQETQLEYANDSKALPLKDGVVQRQDSLLMDTGDPTRSESDQYASEAQHSRDFVHSGTTQQVPDASSRATSTVLARDVADSLAPAIACSSGPVPTARLPEQRTAVSQPHESLAPTQLLTNLDSTSRHERAAATTATHTESPTTRVYGAQPANDSRAPERSTRQASIVTSYDVIRTFRQRTETRSMGVAIQASKGGSPAQEQSLIRNLADLPPAPKIRPSALGIVPHRRIMDAPAATPTSTMYSVRPSGSDFRRLSPWTPTESDFVAGASRLEARFTQHSTERLSSSMLDTYRARSSSLHASLEREHYSTLCAHPESYQQEHLDPRLSTSLLGRELERSGMSAIDDRSDGWLRNRADVRHVKLPAVPLTTLPLRDVPHGRTRTSNATSAKRTSPIGVFEQSAGALPSGSLGSGSVPSQAHSVQNRSLDAVWTFDGSPALRMSAAKRRRSDANLIVTGTRSDRHQNGRDGQRARADIRKDGDGAGAAPSRLYQLIESLKRIRDQPERERDTCIAPGKRTPAAATAASDVTSNRGFTIDHSTELDVALDRAAQTVAARNKRRALSMDVSADDANISSSLTAEQDMHLRTPPLKADQHASAAAVDLAATGTHDTTAPTTRDAGAVSLPPTGDVEQQARSKSATVFGAAAGGARDMQLEAMRRIVPSKLGDDELQVQRTVSLPEHGEHAQHASPEAQLHADAAETTLSKGSSPDAPTLPTLPPRMRPLEIALPRIPEPWRPPSPSTAGSTQRTGYVPVDTTVQPSTVPVSSESASRQEATDSSVHIAPPNAAAPAPTASGSLAVAPSSSEIAKTSLAGFVQTELPHEHDEIAQCSGAPADPKPNTLASASPDDVPRMHAPPGSTGQEQQESASEMAMPQQAAYETKSAAETSAAPVNDGTASRKPNSTETQSIQTVDTAGAALGESPQKTPLQSQDTSGASQQVPATAAPAPKASISQGAFAIPAPARTFHFGPPAAGATDTTVAASASNAPPKPPAWLFSAPTASTNSEPFWFGSASQGTNGTSMWTTSSLSAPMQTPTVSAPAVSSLQSPWPASGAAAPLPASLPWPSLAPSDPAANGVPPPATPLLGAPGFAPTQALGDAHAPGTMAPRRMLKARRARLP